MKSKRHALTKSERYEKALKIAFWYEVLRLIIKWGSLALSTYILGYSMYMTGMAEHPDCDPKSRLFTTIVQVVMVFLCYFGVKICLHGFPKFDDDR